MTVPLISYFLFITIKPEILLNLKYTNLGLLCRRRNHLNMCAVYFLKKKDVEFINVARIFICQQ